MPNAFWIYFAVISVLSAIVTIYDKIAAKVLPRHRIPEKVLLGIGFLGGAAAEWLVMLLIRHKTKHLQFMLLLPLFILIHIVITYFLWTGGIL